jgi:hypothetical protein
VGSYGDSANVNHGFLGLVHRQVTVG